MVANHLTIGTIRLTLSDRVRLAMRRRTSDLLVLPAVVAMLVLMGLPLLFLIYMSLHDWFLEGTSAPTWVGLANFAALPKDDRFVHALWRTLYFTALGLVVEVPCGVALAVLLNQEFPGRRWIRTLLILPMVATPVAMGLVWVIMLDPTIGVIKYLLSLVRLGSAPWLADPVTVLPALVVVDAWEWTPMIALICLAGLASLPPEPLEAAMVDGATAWRRFWVVTLPMLRPTLVVAVIFRVMDLLKVIDIIYVMTRGGPGYASETLNVYNFLVGLFYYREGSGSAIALVLFALVFGIVLLLIRYRRPVWQ